MTRLFSIVRTEHVDCLECEAQAAKAASIGRALGSSISAHSEGEHGARVQRVERAA